MKPIIIIIFLLFSIAGYTQVKNLIGVDKDGKPVFLSVTSLAKPTSTKSLSDSIAILYKMMADVQKKIAPIPIMRDSLRNVYIDTLSFDYPFQLYRDGNKKFRVRMLK